MTGAAAAVPGAAQARARRKVATKRRKTADVVVVGAGLAGLTAARELVKAGVKSVVLLEARDRVGGRTWTKHVDGVAIDVGGQWLKKDPSSYGPVQARMAGLGKEFGVETFNVFYAGNDVGYEQGTRTVYPPGPTQELPPYPASLADAARAIALLDQMSTSVPAGEPWKSPHAAEYDGQTVETWLRDQKLTPSGKRLVDLGIQAILASEPADVSLLYVLHYIVQAGTLENLISTPAGAQQARFVGGAQQISEHLAKALGRRVVLGSPARAITQRKGRVVVDSDRMVVDAKRVVVAITPELSGRIRYAPQLPFMRDQLAQRMPMGTVIKVHAIYDTPFWRADGLTGFTISDRSPVRVTWDNSPKEGKPGVLLGFIEGNDARVWGQKPADERRRDVLDAFTTYFGAKARNPSGYIEQNWAEEEFSRGCYVGITAPGVLIGYGQALRAPCGLIHWAGTETARQWMGYMDGAVESGERVAKEILATL